MSNPVVVKNLNRPVRAPVQVPYCDSFVCRLRGLMFRPALGRDEGLLLVEGRDSRVDASIHMFFVPFDLTVVWIDSHMTVVDKILAKSWRPAYVPKQPGRFILEIHPDRWDDYEVGDKVEFADA